MSSRAFRWFKMIAVGGAMCIGGPALVMYVSPTEEELFKKYNPELQKRSLENRKHGQEDFNKFINQLKEYSKSDKPIWTVMAEEEARKEEEARAKANQARDEQLGITAEVEKRRQDVRGQAQN